MQQQQQQQCSNAVVLRGTPAYRATRRRRNVLQYNAFASLIPGPDVLCPVCGTTAIQQSWRIGFGARPDVFRLVTD